MRKICIVWHAHSPIKLRCPLTPFHVDFRRNCRYWQHAHPLWVHWRCASHAYQHRDAWSPVQWTGNPDRPRSPCACWGFPRYSGKISSTRLDFNTTHLASSLLLYQDRQPLCQLVRGSCIGGVGWRATRQKISNYYIFVNRASLLTHINVTTPRKWLRLASLPSMSWIPSLEVRRSLSSQPPVSHITQSVLKFAVRPHLLSIRMCTTILTTTSVSSSLLWV